MPSSIHRRRGLIGLCAALVALTVTPTGAYATAAPTATPAPGLVAAPVGTLTTAAVTAQQSAPSQTVTLITGDRVTVTPVGGSKSVATVQRPRNLTGAVETVTVGKDLYVYPAEALPYLAAGVLDQRLFDVTKLIADGYDDAHGSGLPLIVQYAGATAGTHAATPAPAGLAPRLALPAIGGAAATVARGAAAGLWQTLTPPAALARAHARAATRTGAAAAPSAATTTAANTAANTTTNTTAAVFGDGVSHVWLDGKVTATLAQSTAQIGTPDAWKAGVDGKGVNVAILDTGIDAAHPDLVGQVAAAQSFVPGEDVTDHHGHGTHTASTIAGTGAASNGVEKGVAPGAHLLVGKVLSDQGAGEDSWIIAGMQWAAQTEHAKVISMSLGSSDPSDGTDPMSQAVDNLSAATGSLFVIAAGNQGAAGIGAPGAADAALTVGAVDAKDQLAWFSSTGPRFLDGGIKPEITAPGVNILAARSQYAAEGSGNYLTMSGTSMATPHVAGAAALLAEQHPDWTGQQLKAALVSTSHETAGIPVTQGGAGRVDVHAAVLGTVDASATAWSGYYPWPHTGDKPAVRTVTYTNTGNASVTLNLAVHATSPDGTAASAAVFTLSAGRVTVPAHGSAQVTVTGDPTAAAYGVTDGQVDATDATDPTGAVVAHTLIGLEREDERYNLTLKATDRSGAPVSGFAMVLRTGDQDPFPLQIPASGSVTVRLPKGEYSAVMNADLPGAAGADDMGMGLLSAPQINLDQNREADLDARQAHRVAAVTPQATDDEMSRVEWNRVMGGVPFNADLLVPVRYTSVWAQSTAPVTDGSFNFVARWRKAAPVLTLTAAGPHSPALSFPDLEVQAGSPMLPAGTDRLDVVSAGYGRSAADYAGLDVKGKAVVVRYDRQADPQSQVQADAAQAAAAHAAGATLLLVVNDATARVSDWWGAADFRSDGPIEVASLQAHEGDALIAATSRPGLRLVATSTPSSPYLYDLVERHDGNVPDADLTYRPARHDLARVTQRFAGSATAPGYNGRYDIQDFDLYGAGYDTKQTLGTTRTDWVTPGSGAGFTWYEQSGITDVVQERAPRAPLAKGGRTETHWLSPVLHPRLGDSRLPNRQNNFFELNIPAWGDAGAGHTGYDFGDYMPSEQLHQTVSLYQGDTLLRSTPHQQLTVFHGVSPSLLPYRLVTETSQSGVFPTSTATRTEWDFQSQAAVGTQANLPLIQLDYGVATDLAGDATQHTTLTLTASQTAGVTGAGSIDQVTLQVSFDDGATWTPAVLQRTDDGSFTTRVKAPEGASFVSLRATAHDTAGNTVSQTVVRAYGVK